MGAHRCLLPADRVSISCLLEGSLGGCFAGTCGSWPEAVEAALPDFRVAVRDGPWASDALLTSTSPLSILECQGLPIVNGQCDPYARDPGRAVQASTASAAVGEAAKVGLPPEQEGQAGCVGLTSFCFLHSPKVCQKKAFLFFTWVFLAQ